MQTITDHDLEQTLKLLNRKWSWLPGGVGVKDNPQDAIRRYDRYLAEENEKAVEKI